MTASRISNPETLNATDIAQLDTLIDKYPYCATYRLLRSVALANVHSTSLNDAVRQASVFLPDRTSLFLHVNNGEFQWVALMDTLREKQQKRQDTTDDFLLIDQYLDHLHLPESAETSSGYDLSTISTPPSAETMDYDLGEPDSTDGEDDTLSLIDSFLSAEAEGQLFTPTAPVKSAADEAAEELEKIKDRAILSESLAKVYVKQHKYEQALAIFSTLNLQYSKKSSYFADQIRFLEKVIAYQKESNEGSV